MARLPAVQKQLGNVSIVFNEKLKSLLLECQKNVQVDNCETANFFERLSKKDLGSLIGMNEVVQLYLLHEDFIDFYDLIRESTIVFPGWDEPDKVDTEFRYKMEMLKNKVENEKYKEISENVQHPLYFHKNDMADIRCISGQVASVVNVFLTIFACFFVGFEFAKDFSPSVRVLSGLSISLIVAVAELYILITRLNSVDKVEK